jgi:hypothetical protein
VKIPKKYITKRGAVIKPGTYFFSTKAQMICSKPLINIRIEKLA